VGDAFCKRWRAAKLILIAWPHSVTTALQCSASELADALNRSMDPIHRELLKLYLERLHLLDQQIHQLDQMIDTALQQHQDAVIRVAEIPGLGVDSAHQLIAEMGVDAEAFPTAG
jgi:transposase